MMQGGAFRVDHVKCEVLQILDAIFVRCSRILLSTEGESYKHTAIHNMKH